MTFERIVKDYEKIKFQIRRLERKEQEVRASDGLPSGGNDGMPKAKSNSSSVENTVVRLTQIIDEKNKLSKKLETKRQELLKLIDRVSSIVAQEIIEIKTFTQRAGWHYISQKMFLSESRCQHLYYDGIKEINDYLKQEKSL